MARNSSSRRVLSRQEQEDLEVTAALRRGELRHVSRGARMLEEDEIYERGRRAGRFDCPPSTLTKVRKFLRNLIGKR